MAPAPKKQTQGVRNREKKQQNQGGTGILRHRQHSRYKEPRSAAQLPAKPASDIPFHFLIARSPRAKVSNARPPIRDWIWPVLPSATRSVLGILLLGACLSLLVVAKCRSPVGSTKSRGTCSGVRRRASLLDALPGAWHDGIAMLGAVGRKLFLTSDDLSQATAIVRDLIYAFCHSHDLDARDARKLSRSRVPN